MTDELLLVFGVDGLSAARVAFVRSFLGHLLFLQVREKSARISQSTGDVGSAAADERDFGRTSVGWQLAVAARLAGHRGGGAAGRQLRRACGCLVFGGRSAVYLCWRSRTQIDVWGRAVLVIYV